VANRPTENEKSTVRTRIWRKYGESGAKVVRLKRYLSQGTRKTRNKLEKFIEEYGIYTSCKLT
jgi:hypothetical protein